MMMATGATPTPRRADAALDATLGSFARLGTELVGRAFTATAGLVVARALGVEGFGVYAVAAGLALVASELGELGLQGTALAALSRGELGLALLLRVRRVLTVAAVGLGVLVSLIPAAAWPDSLRETRALVLPLLAYCVGMGWVEFLGVALRARGFRRAEAALSLLARGSVLAVVAGAWAAGLGARGMAWGQAVAVLSGVALGLRHVGAAYGDEAGGPLLASREELISVLRRAAPVATNVVLALVSLRVELLALALLGDAVEAGLFAAALKLVELANLVPTAVSVGAVPTLAREAREGRAAAAFTRTAQTVVLLAVPAAAGLALLAPVVVQATYGVAFGAAAPVLRLLAPAVFAMFLNAFLMNALLAGGHPGTLPRLTAVRVAVAFAGAAVLVPRLGAAGAAISFALAESVLLALGLRAAGRRRFSRPLGAALATP